MRIILLIASIYFFNSFAMAGFDHFQKALDAHVKERTLPGGGFESSFDYLSARSNPATMKHLNDQITNLKSFNIDTLKTKEQANAFWINAYNFYMIKIILEKGFKDGKLKIKSVKDLGSFFSPYKIFTRQINTVGAKTYSLDQIEKKILLGEEYKRKGWKDARIHFAVNCASVGCPPLKAKVYEAATLNSTLDDNVKKALKTPRHFNMNDKNLSLTHLFKWYKDDFIEHSGSVKKFLQKYKTDRKEQEAIDNATSTKFIDYDWRLNLPSNF